MTRRSVFTLFIMAFILPLNELHKCFDNVYMTVSPFLLSDYELDIQWFVKFLCEKMSWCLSAVVLYRLARWNKEMQTAVIVFFIYRVIDLLLFFICFNREFDLIAYSLFCLITVVVVGIKFSVKKKTTNVQGVQVSDTTKLNNGSAAKYKNPEPIIEGV